MQVLEQMYAIVVQGKHGRTVNQV